MMTSIVLDCFVFGNIFLFFGSLMEKLGEILKKYCFNVFFIKKYFKKQTNYDLESNSCERTNMLLVL